MAPVPFRYRSWQRPDTLITLAFTHICKSNIGTNSDKRRLSRKSRRLFLSRSVRIDTNLYRPRYRDTVLFHGHATWHSLPNLRDSIFAADYQVFVFTFQVGTRKEFTIE